MGYAAALAIGEAQGFGCGDHLLVWSWRRMATRPPECPLLMDAFAAACGEDGPEVFVTFCIFLQALALCGRRQLMIGIPGCSVLTPDERRMLTLLAAAQAEVPALLEAQLRWIALAEKRHILEIATGGLSRALSTNGLRIALPSHEIPTLCERPRATA